MILQMNIYGTLLIIFTVIIRSVAINKLPKKVFIVLWLIAVSRLLIPYTTPQIINLYSVVNALNEVSGDKFIAPQPQDELTQLDTPDISGINTERNEIWGANQITSDLKKINISFYTIIWLVGISALGVIFIIPHITQSRKYRAALPIEDDYIISWVASHRLFRKYKVMVSDEIASPFTYGLFRPVIIMPENIDMNNRELKDYILTHEYIHIKRVDIALKWLSAFTLCVNWFNPLVWVMYILMNRDIELSCDEGVVRLKGETNKKSYAMTLLEMESKKVSFNPLANHYNKNSLKERVTAIMKIRKITILSTVLAFVLIAGSGLILVSAYSENIKDKTANDIKEVDGVNANDGKNNEPKENTNPMTATEESPEYITIGGMKLKTSLTELNLQDKQLNNSDIEDLKYMVNLTWLNLNYNQISDISSLAGLTDLKSLGFAGDKISDISPLAGLTNLTTLDLEGNQISDLSALAGLTNLTTLGLGNNRISDISALAKLTDLTYLTLHGNKISDIGALAGLTNLTTLRVSENQISDISPLAGLTNLTKLTLNNNRISDISSLAGLINLTNLGAFTNQISDISPLTELTNLAELYLEYNRISDISSLAGLTNLKGLVLSYNVKINDISVLFELPNLERLWVHELAVSSNQLDELREAFPYAEINY